MKPVYEFTNFRLTDVVYSREENDSPSKTEIKAKITNEKGKYIVLTSIVAITFTGRKVSELKFTSSYMINDEKWADDLGATRLTSVLFSAVFPFIREKIFNITSDSRTPILLPVIDLKNVDISHGVVFEKKQNLKI